MASEESENRILISEPKTKIKNGSKYIPLPSGKGSKRKIKNAKKVPTEIESFGDFPKFGYYSIFCLFLQEAIYLPQCANMTSMIYAGFSPTLESCGDHSFANLSNTEACARYSEIQNGTSCIPKLSSQFESVAYEFGYFCSSVSKVKQSISFQMLGVLIGAVVFGQLSDLFGRKRTMILCAIGAGIFNWFASNSFNLFWFTFHQFWSLFFTGGTNTICTVFLMESIPKKHRVWTTLAISWSPNFIIIAIIAYLCQTWRMFYKILAICNIPTIILLLLAYESPRWLIQRGHLKKAKKTYENIEKWNGTTSPERQQILEYLVDKEVEILKLKKKVRKYYFHHLFYTSKMVLHSVILSFTLFCTAVITYALMFNMEKLSGSLYWNNAIFGVIRYIFNLSFGFADYKCPKLGRKLVHRIAVTFVAIMLLLVFVIKAFELDYSTISNLAILSGAAMTSQLFVIGFIVSGEIFPTPVRNISASFQQIFTRLGTIISPHFFIYTSFWLPAPYLFMAIIMIANLLAFYFVIPETKGHPMIDHMPDKSERIFTSKKAKQSLLQSDVTSSNIKLDV
jgi:OCT family organic cation transporter-like MFS transporter 4/5